MRTTLLIAITAGAALLASQAFAEPPPADAAPKAHSMEGIDPAAMHEMCKSVMGHHMDPKAVHEHSREKGGMVMWPNGKPLTEAEMAQMHKQCAAKMAATPAPETPKK